MFKSLSFPSVYEATNQEFYNAEVSLIDALKIKFQNTDYLVGNAAMEEGLSPHKSINSSPESMEYQLLAQAGQLVCGATAKDEVFLTTGFPFSTYILYKDKAQEVLKGKHTIELDASLCGGKQQVLKEVNVVDVQVIPELVGCNLAIREGDLHDRGDFFLVSIGYGTCEAAVFTRSGLVNRSALSTHGIRHAVTLFTNELAKSFYLNMKTEHQMDAAFARGTMTVNREKHNMLDIREKVLKMYYREMVSPNLRRSFTDDDFNRCSKMYLAGGGALYPELVNCFKEEFGDLVSVEVYPEPEKCASQGYSLHAKSTMDARKDKDFEKMDAEAFMNSGRKLAVGLDVGNANTCVTVYTEGE